MAKAPPKPAAEGDAPPAKSKKLLVIIIVLLVVLIAGGAGAFFMLKGSKAEEGADSHEPAKKAVKVNHDAPPAFMTLDSFTTNLAREEGDHYVQAVIVLRLADAHIEPELKALMPELRHRVNLLLTSKLPSQLSSMDGRQELAEEILVEANDILGYEPPRRTSSRRGSAPEGPVLAVLFNSFIVQ